MTIQRPEHWTPEWIVEQREKGRESKEILQQVSEETGLSVRTLFRDVQEWKKADPSFKNALLSAERRPPRRFKPAAFTPELKLEFLTHLLECEGNLAMAVRKTGGELKRGHIYAAINPKSSLFDPEFTESYWICKGEAIGKLEDVAFEYSLKADEKHQNASLLMRALEATMGQVWNTHRSVEVTGTIEHRHSMMPALTSHHVEAQRQALLPPGQDDVVDGEVVE